MNKNRISTLPHSGIGSSSQSAWYQTACKKAPLVLENRRDLYNACSRFNPKLLWKTVDFRWLPPNSKWLFTPRHISARCHDSACTWNRSKQALGHIIKTIPFPPFAVCSRSLTNISSNSSCFWKKTGKWPRIRVHPHGSWTCSLIKETKVDQCWWMGWLMLG